MAGVFTIRAAVAGPPEAVNAFLPAFARLGHEPKSVSDDGSTVEFVWLGGLPEEWAKTATAEQSVVELRLEWVFEDGVQAGTTVYRNGTCQSTEALEDIFDWYEFDDS